MKDLAVKLLHTISDYVIYLITAIVTILAPIGNAMIGVGVLILIDLIMGVIAAKKQKIKLSSRRLSNTAVKMLVYQLLIISAFVAETYISDWIPFLETTLGFIGLVELFSIGENFSLITGLPFIKFMTKHIQKAMKKWDEDEVENIVKKRKNKKS